MGLIPSISGLDWKHVVSFVVGVILTLVSAKFGVDFSQVCPSAPVATQAVQK